jgi:hypothetical protein
MSSQLHEAVQLAQTGRRGEARQMLWQVVQSEPNNEMAWLWLASVAADQAEYQRALNEVLRINPMNGQARQLLSQYQQQYAAPPPPAYGPSPSAPAPYYGAPLSPAAPYYAGPYAQPQPQKRRKFLGCGCVQSCLLALVVLVILPAVACAGLSATGKSLGIFDWFAVYLPGNMGRKNVQFDVAGYSVSITVPRSWQPAVKGDIWWESYRNALETNLPFEDTTRKWADYEVDLAAITSLTSLSTPISILETSPVPLMESGALSGISFGGLVSASNVGFTSFQCSDVRSGSDQLETGGVTVQILEKDQGLCAVRADQVEKTGTEAVFKGYTPPEEQHSVYLVIPIDQNTAAVWMVTVPESQFNEGNINKMAETAKVEKK